MSAISSQNSAPAVVSELLDALGVAAHLSSLEKTAARVAAMYEEVFEGVHVDTSELVEPLPHETSGEGAELIRLSSIQFYSMCEHHFLPFFGYIDVAYVPDTSIVGLGRIDRLVHALSRRPQLQERLTSQLASHLQAALRPRGVAVHVVARHLCEAMRGSRATTQVFSTFALSGVLETHTAYREPFLASVTGLSSTM